MEAEKGVGVFLIVVIAVIVGLTLLTSSADNINTVTVMQTATNQSVAIVSNGTAITLRGQEISGSAVVTNATAADGVAIATSNYTVASAISNGAKILQIKTKDSRWNGNTLFVTYTYEPIGYISDGGGRAIAGLVIIFAALAIAITALTPVLRENVLGMLGK